MTQEDKRLLLKDLSARLPYGVKYCRDSWNYEWDQEMSVVEVLEDIDKDGYINYYKVYKVDDIKPYLRPMSSMIGSERITYEELSLYHEEFGEYVPTLETFDWLNAHHFDYRGLIEKGFALEALEGMYKDN